MLRVLSTGLAGLLLLFTIEAGAQTRSVKNYTLQDGLPSAEVFHILQDRSGFLWFSTSHGIASFDGYEMKVFSAHDGVPDPLILETREDESGKIWMRSLSGRIAYQQDGIIYPYTFNDSLSKFCSNGFMEAFAQDSTGRWHFYESTDHSCTVKADGSINSQELPRGRIAITDFGEQLVIQTSIYEDEDEGIVMIDGKEFHINVPYVDAKFTHNHYSVLRWKGNIYFSIRNILFRYDGDTVTRVFTAGAPIINLSTDSHDRFYIGHTNYGAIQFETEDFLKGDTLLFTKNQSVTDIQEDHEGGLWVSTLEAGVFYMPSTGIDHYFLPEDHQIRTALVHQGQIFIGTYEGLVMSLDEKTKTIRGQRKFDRVVLSLYAHNDTLFAGTSTLMYVMTNLSKEPVHKYLGSVHKFVETDRNVLVLSGRNMASLRFDGVETSRFRHQQTIRDICIDGPLYYSPTHLGLTICNSKLVPLSRPKDLENLKISQFQKVNDTTFIIGTIGNGLLVTNKSFTRITKFESLPRDIFSLAKLDNNYYFASELGIFKISTEDIVNRSAQTFLLNANNGLLKRSISLLQTTSDNKLIVFYDNAFSIVNPAALKNLNHSPRFYIDRIAVNNEKMNNRKHYRLPYDSNTVQLDFGFVSFNNQDINIRYRLHEDDSWIYPRRTNSINLYSLSPGFYKPQLEYSADRFTWQKADALPTFHITYPWWQNPYLQAVAVLGLFIVGFIIVGNRLEIQKERNERLKLLTIQQQQLLDTEKVTTDRERNRIAKDLHDSVGSSLLATKLSVGRILKRYNHQEADEIEGQLSNTLNEIKSIIYDLSPTELERDGLSLSVKNYIDKLSGVTDIQLNVVFYGEDITDVRIITPVFRILQELLSNSIKYSNGNSIALHINSFDKLLNIVYEDNGQGFSPKLSKGLGRGLTNIEARVRTLNGRLKSDSGDYGTSFIIEIPKSSSVTL